MSRFTSEMVGGEWCLGGRKSTKKLTQNIGFQGIDLLRFPRACFTEMEESLQYLFVKSKGKPVRIGDRVFVQCCEIPMTEGEVRVRLLSNPDPNQGICIDAGKGGTIELSDGSRAKRLYIWHEPDLPDTVVHRIQSPTKRILMWNIYRIHHPTGETTEDFWTGNSGMVLVKDFPTHRRYVCTDWRTPLEASAIEFEVEWREEKKRLTEGS